MNGKQTENRAATHDWVSKKMWKFWVDFRKVEENDGFLYRQRNFEKKTGQVIQELIVAETQFPQSLPILHESLWTGRSDLVWKKLIIGRRIMMSKIGLIVVIKALEEQERRKKHRHNPTTWQSSHAFRQISLFVIGPISFLRDLSTFHQ